MKRKLLGFASGAVVAVAGYYLMLIAVLSIWGLNVNEWATAAMVAIPTGLAVATCAWVIRRDAPTIVPALAVGLGVGVVIALVADLFVDGLEISIVGVVTTLAVEAFVLDPDADTRQGSVEEAKTESHLPF